MTFIRALGRRRRATTSQISLNNLIEQDQRYIKRHTRPSLGFFAFNTAQRTLSGYETMTMVRKGQVKAVDKGDVLAQMHLINRLFEVAA